MRRQPAQLFIIVFFAGGIALAQPATQPAAPAAPAAAAGQPAVLPPPPTTTALPAGTAEGAAPGPAVAAPDNEAAARARAADAAGIPDKPTPSYPGSLAPLPPPSAPIDESESNESLLARAQSLMEERQFEQASGLLGALLRRDPTSVQARVMLASIGEERQDFTAAREYYRSVLRDDPTNFAANLGMGRSFLNARYFRNVPKYLEVARAKAPNDAAGAEVLTMLAMAYRGEKQLEKGIEAAQQAVRLDPQSFDARATLVMLLMEMRLYREAADQATNLLSFANEQRALNPGDRGKLAQLNVAYDTRISVLSRWHNELYEKNARGELTDRLLPGQEQEAGAILRETALDLMGQNEVRRLLSLYDPLALLEKAVAYSPRDTVSMLQLARLYRDTAQDAKALETARKLLELEPGNEQAQKIVDALSSPLSTIGTP